jgi:hypothetical protein
VVLIIAKIYSFILEPGWSLMQILEYLIGSAEVSAPFCSVSCGSAAKGFSRSGYQGSPLQQDEGTLTKPGVDSRTTNTLL